MHTPKKDSVVTFRLDSRKYALLESRGSASPHRLARDIVESALEPGKHSTESNAALIELAHLEAELVRVAHLIARLRDRLSGSDGNGGAR